MIWMAVWISVERALLSISSSGSTGYLDWKEWLTKHKDSLKCCQAQDWVLGLLLLLMCTQSLPSLSFQSMTLKTTWMPAVHTQTSLQFLISLLKYPAAVDSSIMCLVFLMCPPTTLPTPTKPLSLPFFQILINSTKSYEFPRTQLFFCSHLPGSNYVSQKHEAQLFVLLCIQTPVMLEFSSFMLQLASSFSLMPPMVCP